jgi:glycosyltransferase involved in cell wall biosynthesis
MKKMTIGIEGQRLFRPRKHGMDIVALELIRHLQVIDKVNDYVIFVKPDEDDKVIHETPNFRIVCLEGGSYPQWEQVALPRAARQAGCDILHCTSNTAPVSSGIPLVLTLHDIIYLEKGYLGILGGSGTPYQKAGNVYRRAIVPRVVRNSSRIITVSEFEKKRISSFFGMNEDPKLVSVYNGVGDHFMRVKDSVEREKMKAKYRLPDNFFFFLGNTDPKKNTRGTLRAFSDFVDTTGSDMKLVMLDFDRDELQKLLREIGNPGLIERIHLTGYVVNSDLPALYSLCRAFLYPSLRESFGIPLLEAMACGTPVITSNTSSMPEIAGEAALLVDPFKTTDITRAMITVNNDEPLREKMTALGYIQAAKFSWRAMAEGVHAVYCQLGEAGSSYNHTKGI